MSDLTREEQETNINWTAQDRIDGVAHIYTDDPVEIKRLESHKLVADSETEHGKHFLVDTSRYSITVRRKRVMSAENRRRAGERLRRAHNTAGQGGKKPRIDSVE